MAAQRAWFPMEYLKVTQKRYGSYSHAQSEAMDFGGRDGGKDRCYAPYRARVVGFGNGNTGELYIESVERVLAPNGRVDYQWMTLMHADSYRVAKGQVLEQWSYFYDEGGKGYGKAGYYAAHMHMECGFGRHPGRLVMNAAGRWITPGQAHIEECLFVGPCTEVDAQDGGYDWVRDGAGEAAEEGGEGLLEKGKVFCGAGLEVLTSRDAFDTVPPGGGVGTARLPDGWHLVYEDGLPITGSVAGLEGVRLRRADTGETVYAGKVEGRYALEEWPAERIVEELLTEGAVACRVCKRAFLERCDNCRAAVEAHAGNAVLEVERMMERVRECVDGA